MSERKTITVFCAWCDWTATVPLDLKSMAMKAVRAHARSCDYHPMYEALHAERGYRQKVEEDNERLRGVAEFAEHRRGIERGITLRKSQSLDVAGKREATALRLWRRGKAKIRDLEQQLSRCDESIDAGGCRIIDLERQVEELTIPADWTPLPANVNALPDPLREYIANLETRCDPSGDIRELTISRDTTEALERQLDEWKQGARVEARLHDEQRTRANALAPKLEAAEKRASGMHRRAQKAEGSLAVVRERCTSLHEHAVTIWQQRCKDAEFRSRATEALVEKLEKRIERLKLNIADHENDCACLPENWSVTETVSRLKKRNAELEKMLLEGSTGHDVCGCVFTKPEKCWLCRAQALLAKSCSVLTIDFDDDVIEEGKNGED